MVTSVLLKYDLGNIVAEHTKVDIGKEIKWYRMKCSTPVTVTTNLTCEETSIPHGGYSKHSAH